MERWELIRKISQLDLWMLLFFQVL